MTPPASKRAVVAAGGQSAHWTARSDAGDPWRAATTPACKERRVPDRSPPLTMALIRGAADTVALTTTLGRRDGGLDFTLRRANEHADGGVLIHGFEDDYARGRGRGLIAKRAAPR
jgi:hypothetical protein